MTAPGDSERMRRRHRVMVLTPLVAPPGILALGYLRLSQIAEEAGNRTKAADYCTQLVGLLSEADAQLQPLVTQARRALDCLTREPGRT